MSNAELDLVVSHTTHTIQSEFRRLGQWVSGVCIPWTAESSLMLYLWGRV